MRFSSLIYVLGLFSFGAVAQSVATESTLSSDSLTARPLGEVVVRAYESNRSLITTGAAVGVVSRRELVQRFATPNLVPTLNTLPGVRMDERSPGSYRLSIRGSLIRSPFGVRNVKVYYDEMPLTDAGGNTSLNALDVRMLGRVEIIKGPSGSLYGANTGGTVLLSGPSVSVGTSRAEAGYLMGSYGLRGWSGLVQTASGKAGIAASVNHLQSDGYRDHSALVRDNVAVAGTVRSGASGSVKLLFIYSDLHYQTPGGLTEAQFRANPAASRLATRTLPGSAEQQAGIYQKTGYLGLGHTIRWNAAWQTSTVAYGSITQLINPFITNYEQRADVGFGGRTVTRFTNQGTAGQLFTTSFGGEWQRNWTRSEVFGNRRGQRDTVQSQNHLWAIQGNVFVQQEAQLQHGIVLTAGLSVNQVRYRSEQTIIRRQLFLGTLEDNRPFKPVLLGRLSALKTLGSDASVYINWSSGYSAPTSQEVLSSAGFFNANLNPERGQQVELGLRGRLFERLTFDVVGYSLGLRETIVRRSQDNGAEFFVNAGRTQQTGLETYLSYDVLRSPPSTLGAATPSLKLWQSLTLANYRYQSYQQLATDFSGNRVPGIAPFVGVWGADLELPVGLYAHLTYQFLPPFALNDANTAQGDPTRLLQATVGYKTRLGKRFIADLYAGGDNLLDQTYSLGYDLNAAGNRFFNAAPRRNGTVGLRLSSQ